MLRLIVNLTSHWMLLTFVIFFSSYFVWILKKTTLKVSSKLSLSSKKGTSQSILMSYNCKIPYTYNNSKSGSKNIYGLGLRKKLDREDCTLKLILRGLLCTSQPCACGAKTISCEKQANWCNKRLVLLTIWPLESLRPQYLLSLQVMIYRQLIA
jgi:hypothetical protein